MNAIAQQHVFKSSFNWAQPWRHAFPALMLLVAWTLWLYRDTAVAIVNIWSRSETFTHGFLVPPIVFWLIWRQRGVVAALTPHPAPGALLAIAGVAFGWLLGDLAAVNAVTQLALASLLVLTVPAVLGWRITHQIIFPLGFLFFAVPIGDFLMPAFMEWTANFTVIALRLSGIPVYREGLNFVIPSGSWSVVEACSGVRYLIASLTVGTLFAYLNYQSSKRRILFVIVSIVVPIVANWLRAYIIVLLGHLSGNKLAAGVDHLIYGWVFFGVVIMLMFVIGARWAEPEQVPSVSSARAPSPKQMVTAATYWTSAACFAALVALPHVALWAMQTGEGADPVAFKAPPAMTSGWQSVIPVVADFKPAYQNPSAEINTSYASRGRTVGLYLGYYQQQNYSRKLVSSNNALVVSQDPRWVQVASGRRVVTLGDKSVAMRTAELRGTGVALQADDGRLVIWQIYWINGTITANNYLAKVYGAFDRLMGRDDDSAVIVVYTTKDQKGGADAVLDTFLSNNYAAINEQLLKMRQSK